MQFNAPTVLSLATPLLLFMAVRHGFSDCSLSEQERRSQLPMTERVSVGMEAPLLREGAASRPSESMLLIPSAQWGRLWLA